MWNNAGARAPDAAPDRFTGYLRADGRKGIRNTLLVVYLVECAHHVAREIAYPFRDRGVHLIGFSGCYPNKYSLEMMQTLCTHPNVGAVLLVSLGCEGFNRRQLQETIAASGRPVGLDVIQEAGGTRLTIAEGQRWVHEALDALERDTPRVPMGLDEVVVGTICGGSDATSGITANPAIGRALDLLVARGGRAIFEETGELIGCEQVMAGRATTPALGAELVRSVEKARTTTRCSATGASRPATPRAASRRRRRSRWARTRRAAARRSPAFSSPGTYRRTRGSTSSTSSRTARCASGSRTSTTRPRTWS
jgi:altronate dehydratase